MIEQLDPYSLTDKDVEDCFNDFRNYLWVVYRCLGLITDRITMDIAGYIQETQETKEDIMVMAMRGIGKSYVTDVFGTFQHWHNKDEHVIVCCGGENKALEYISFAKNIIDMLPFLHHLRPKQDGRVQDSKAQRWSQTAYDVSGKIPSQAPSCRAIGIDGNMTGSRGTLIIADDIETAKNSRTAIQREKIREAAKEFLALGLPGSRRVYLGTPQSEDTVYNEICDGVRIRKWPARYPEISELEEKYPDLAPMLKDELLEKPELAGTPTCPERYNEDDLLFREGRNGKSWMQLHYMLDPSLSDALRYPLKVRDLIVSSLELDKGPNSIGWSYTDIRKDLDSPGFIGDYFTKPSHVDKDNWFDYTGKIMAVDPSGSGEDECGIAVLNELNARLFLMKWTGLMGGYHEKIPSIVKMAKKYDVREIVVEANFGDGMFEELIKAEMVRQKWGCHVESVKFTSKHGYKEQRIISILEPVMNSHRLVVDESVIKEQAKVEKQLYDGFFQMTRLMKMREALKKDDRIDALALAVFYYIENIGRVEEVEEQHNREEAMRLFNDHRAYMLKHPFATREEIDEKFEEEYSQANWLEE